MGHAVKLPDDQRSLRLIVETQGLHFASFDLDGLGGSVQHIAFQCLGFPSGHRSAGLQTVDDDAAVFVGDVFTVVGAYDLAAGISHQERHAFQGCRRSLDVLLDYQRGAGGIVERNRLCVVGIDDHSLGLGTRVNGIARDGLGLCDYQGAHHTIDLDLAVLVSLIEAVAGDIAVFIGDKFTSAGRYLKGNSLKGLTSLGIPLINNQGASFGVRNNNRLGVPILANHHIGRGLVHDVPLGSLDFG